MRVSFDSLGGGARCTGVVGGFDGEELASSRTPLDRFLKFEPASVRPSLYRGELRFCAPLGASAEGDVGSLAIERIDYVAWNAFSCLFRHRLQGASLAEGAALSDVCGAIDGGGAWNASAVSLREGFRTIALAHERADGDGTYRAVLTLADGVAYPLSLHVERVDGDGARNATYTLEALATDGAPFGEGEPLAEPAPLPSAPLDPLLGPDDAGARLPVRLRDAARAAIADPTLTELQALLAKPDAVLAGAALRAQAPSGAPTALDATWALVFSAPGSARVIVTCGGAASPVPIPTDPPLARCAAQGNPDFDLGEPPEGFGAADMPPAAVAFRDALARLETRDPGAATRAITFAMYRAWDEPAEKERASLGLAAQATGPTPDGAETSYVSTIDLATGRSAYDFRDAPPPLVVSAVPAGIAAGGIATGPPPGADGRASSAPLLVGAGVAAVGLLALAIVFWTTLKAFLAALFTRLVRPRVLDAELRASIHELVLSRPGVHANEVVTHFGRGTGAIQYHLDVLVREGFLTTLKTTGYRHYFVTGRFSPAEMRALAALRAGQGEKLYRIIEANPGIHVQALAEQAGLSVGYVSKEVKRMNEAGLVDQVKVGRAVRLHALDR